MRRCGPQMRRCEENRVVIASVAIHAHLYAPHNVAALKHFLKQSGRRTTALPIPDRDYKT
jgi:hypothetical protein